LIGFFCDLGVMVADSERKYIFMDNVDMVYMNIMICWNIIMVMCIYFGPAGGPHIQKLRVLSSLVCYWWSYVRTTWSQLCGNN
jgi:hypothetical protein